MPVIYGIGFNLFLMSCNFYMAVFCAVLYTSLAGRHSYYGYSPPENFTDSSISKKD
jgi:hypothetical protein